MLSGSGIAGAAVMEWDLVGGGCSDLSGTIPQVDSGDKSKGQSFMPHPSTFTRVNR
ncbi:hypothetical protein NBRC116598_04770 [Pseudophaeobacter arcticus]|uniref:Uncharacterized protein n=1 Tax=Pseudophaeobacter arcticus TaxID=385492 RepID=A0ABQ0AGS5_9RHOB